MSILSLSLAGFLIFSQTPVDRIVAVVNNEVILESDLTAVAKKAEKTALIEEVLLQGSAPGDLKKSREARLSYLINERLMDAAVKRLGLSATQERVDQEIKQMASRYKTTASEILKAAKADMGFSEEEYRSFLKKQVERQGLIEAEVSSKVRVSDEEVYAEFRKINPRSKTSLGEVTISHIFFNPKKGGEQKARERAEIALEKLRTGATFSSVAEQHSEDSRFTSGGLLGTFGPDELLPEFESALSGVVKGQYSEIVKSKRGLHILYLNDAKTGKNVMFEKNKEKIRSYLTEKSFEKQFALWLKRSREEATINQFGKK